MIAPTRKQRDMARFLNLHPERFDTWPFEIIDHMAQIEDRKDLIVFAMKVMERWRSTDGRRACCVHCRSGYCC